MTKVISLGIQFASKVAHQVKSNASPQVSQPCLLFLIRTILLISLLWQTIQHFWRKFKLVKEVSTQDQETSLSWNLFLEGPFQKPSLKTPSPVKMTSIKPLLLQWAWLTREMTSQFWMFNNMNLNWMMKQSSLTRIASMSMYTYFQEAHSRRPSSLIWWTI